jgi:hypothetical protein
LPWWQLEPHPDLVKDNALCLALPGKYYVLYLPKGGGTTVTLESGSYQAKWYNPRTGEYTPLPPVSGGEQPMPTAPENQDWVLLLQKS